MGLWNPFLDWHIASSDYYCYGAKISLWFVAFCPLSHQYSPDIYMCLDFVPNTLGTAHQRLFWNANFKIKATGLTHFFAGIANTKIRL